MSAQDYENTIAKLDKRVERLSQELDRERKRVAELENLLDPKNVETISHRPCLVCAATAGKLDRLTRQLDELIHLAQNAVDRKGVARPVENSGRVALRELGTYLEALK